MKYKCLNNLSENNPDKLYLILFYTDWCEPCVETINIINDINYNNLEKYYIDLEELENEDISNHFNINALPSIVFLKRKNIIKIVSGSRNKNTYIDIIENN